MNPLILAFVWDWLAGKPKAGTKPGQVVKPPSKPDSTVTKATAAAKPAVAVRAATQPAPWPAAVPSDLPPWPSGWEADVPAKPEVQARALQLIKPLHGGGLGSRVQDYIGGRWLTFVATIHDAPTGPKKAVEAFRPKKGIPASDGRASAAAAAARGAQAAAMPGAVRTPQQAAMVVPVAAVQPVAAVVPESAHAVSPVAPEPSAGPAIPSTVKFGSSGPDVVRAQSLLGTTPDGKFGKNTDAAARAYQKAHGLKVDGIVGPKTWASLLGV